MQSPAYLDGSHKDHAATVARANSMAKQIFGEGPADEDGVESGTNSEKPLYANVPRPTLPPGVAWSAGAEKFTRQFAHKHGLPDEVVKDALREQAERTIAAHKGRQMEIKEGFQALRNKWGGDFDRKLAFAKEAVRRFDPRLGAALDRTGLGNAPEFAEVFFALGEAMKEGGLMVSDVDGIKDGKEARAEIRRLMSSTPYSDRSHKNHAAVVEAVNKLMIRIHGTETVEDD